MKPDGFLEAAKKMVSFGAGGSRSAISRAYYACFHTGLDALKSIGCTPARDRSHRQLPAILRKSGHTGAKHAATLLDDLRDDRRDADYDLNNTDVEDRNNAMKIVVQAVDCTSLLEAFELALQSDEALAASVNTYADSIRRL